MAALNQIDYVMFIDDVMARLIIAWMRMDTTESDPILDGATCRWSPRKITQVMGLSRGQVSELIEKSLYLGIINKDGSVSDSAQTVVQAMINSKIKEIRGD